MAFKDNLQRLLDARDWTPAHLAAAVSDLGGSLHVLTIQRWLADERKIPHSASVFLVAQALGVTPNDLLLERRPETNLPANPAFGKA